MKNSQPILTVIQKFGKVNGQVMHGIKASEPTFVDFGEAYFSTIDYKKCNGWKLHNKMTLNIIVPSGEIRFIILNANQPVNEKEIIPLMDVTIGENNYSRLTIPPKFWVAFEGVGLGKNILLNVSDIEHDPTEAIDKKPKFFHVKNFHPSR